MNMMTIVVVSVCVYDVYVLCQTMKPTLQIFKENNLQVFDLLIVLWCAQVLSRGVFLEG